MLETKIEELIKAIDRNSDIMERIHAGEHRLKPAPEARESKPPKDVATASRPADAASGTRQSSEQSNEVPNEKPKSEPTASTSQPSSSESAPVTYDDVKRATNAVSKISRDKAVAGLARFGVWSATKLTEQQWPGYVAYMTRVAAGELDPESAHE